MAPPSPGGQMHHRVMHRRAMGHRPMHPGMRREASSGGDAITEQLNREELARIQGGGGAAPPPMGGPESGPPPGPGAMGPRPSGH